MNIFKDPHTILKKSFLQHNIYLMIIDQKIRGFIKFQIDIGHSFYIFTKGLLSLTT